MSKYSVIFVNFILQALAKVVSNGDSFPESEVDAHVARLFLLDFLQSGIHLDDDARKVVVKLNDRILQVGQQFAAGSHQGCSDTFSHVMS